MDKLINIAKLIGTDKLINIVVSFSNLYGLKLINGNLPVTINVYTMSVISASMLMHISEKKHNLSGIYPFNKYSSYFLWYDRICAYAGIIYVFKSLYYIPDMYIFTRGLFGLLMLGISENLLENKHLFMISHATWHLLAYNVLGRAIHNNYMIL